MTFILVAGSIVGIYIGPMGLTKYWYWLGNQGWEYVEPGKLWQGLLFAIFVLWALTLYRALKPAISLKQPWALTQLAGLCHLQYFNSFNLRLHCNAKNQFCDS